MMQPGLLLLADGRFPSGGHAQSAGVESAVAHGDVVDIETLERYLAGRLATTGLVDAAFAWSRDRGYRAACLHFATANATSSSFWTGVGFTPVMAHLRRRLDERILTNRPPV